MRDQADGLVVNVRHAGGAWGRMGDRDVRALDGAVVLTDMALGNTHVSEASVSTSFVLPRWIKELVEGGAQ